ncbi:MAG: ribonuclease HII [Acaryochloridaceae cyanobacterium SU_2_1]|nr:ribonuclease HII [Acaryochloridaceae cyanobacterium SU_2_1]NJM95124.1 ribonuclease HII [Acaryochloridaceae cyanobacterium CSU_5_19]
MFSGQYAGVDEVGRGALFGPVVAAAVILPATTMPALLEAGMRDSKQLSAQQRFRLNTQIRERAIATQIGLASVYEIDRFNILQASLLAMRRAVLRLTVQPEFCWVDGNQRIPELDIPQQTLVKGDQLEPAIAAASIIAKVWRDQLIIRLSRRYPGYDLAANKGYGSAKHRLALQQIGPSPQHRLSFRPCHESQRTDSNASVQG